MHDKTAKECKCSLYTYTLIVGKPKVAHEHHDSGTGQGDGKLQKETKNLQHTNIRKRRGAIFHLGSVFVLWKNHICGSANSKGTCSCFINMVTRCWNQTASKVHSMRQGWTHMHCGACSNDLQWHGWAPEARCVANALHVADFHADL